MRCGNGVLFRSASENFEIPKEDVPGRSLLLSLSYFFWVLSSPDREALLEVVAWGAPPKVIISGRAGLCANETLLGAKNGTGVKPAACLTGVDRSNSSIVVRSDGFPGPSN
mmetsp:Transcript_12891/g.26694  ORF Transcript_12891/g.26694 Transcript_12891/m.26694 type:complete len:111 (+) Transcript_12891:682-1014(+)